MLYVITGHMRTGTSMMMKALEEGGLDAAYRQSREEMRERYADNHYDPNIGGLYELEQRDYSKPLFPRGYDGKLIKGLGQCVPLMCVMPKGIRVIMMRRNAEEIRQSYDAFFGRQLTYHKAIDANMGLISEKIANRKDVKSFHMFWFRSVVERPREHFQRLKDAGWPLDVEKAASVVNPQYCRFRIENLAVGIV